MPCHEPRKAKASQRYVHECRAHARPCPHTKPLYYIQSEPNFKIAQYACASAPIARTLCAFAFVVLPVHTSIGCTPALPKAAYLVSLSCTSTTHFPTLSSPPSCLDHASLSGAPSDPFLCSFTPLQMLYSTENVQALSKHHSV